MQRSRLFVVLPGVYALGPGPHARRAHWLAAVWWCAARSARTPGTITALSHLSAGAFHGLGDEPDPCIVHVTTVGEARSRPGVVVHRAEELHALDISRHGLLTVTNRSRTLVDEAALLPFPAFRARADQLRELPLRELEATLRRSPGRPGCGAARRLLAGEQRHTRSELERRLLAFCDLRGLPRPPELNVRVAGHRADGVYRGARLVVELDGRSYHERRAAFEADRRRDADYQLAGFRILRLTWWDFEPEWVGRTAATLRAFLDGSVGR